MLCRLADPKPFVRAFREMDVDHSDSLSFDEFSKAAMGLAARQGGATSPVTDASTDLTPEERRWLERMIGAQSAKKAKNTHASLGHTTAAWRVEMLYLDSKVRRDRCQDRLRAKGAREEKLRQLDRKIYGFYTEDRRSFYWGTGSYLAGWMFDIVEIMLVAHLLGFGAEVSWAHAFAIEAFISVARGFNTVVPGALGVQDFSVVGLFKLFGLPDELGLKYAIIRRGRDVVFAVLGWAFLYFDEATLRGFQKRLTEEAEEMEREQSG